MSSAHQIFQQAYTTGALFPLYFGVLAVAFGGASLANGRLVIKHGMRRLSKTAALSIAMVSAIAWVHAFTAESLPPPWLFMTYMVVVFVCFGLLFGNLNALAMEPLGHIAGVGAAAVTSFATFIALPLGTFVVRASTVRCTPRSRPSQYSGRHPSQQCDGSKEETGGARPAVRPPEGDRARRRVVCIADQANAFRSNGFEIRRRIVDRACSRASSTFMQAATPTIFQIRLPSTWV